MSYSSSLLFLYGGSSLASPTAIFMLRLYCVYVLVLGQNGISEAFFMVTLIESVEDRPQQNHRY